MIRRSLDAGEINAIVNHPDVFPAVSVPGIERIDLAPQLAERHPDGTHRNVLLMAEGGGVVFFWLAPGLYEVHTNFLPNHRGRHALRASLAAYRWMFAHTDCMAIVTRIPAWNRAAEVWARKAGFTLEFARRSVWPMHDGSMVDLRFYALRYDDWARQTPELVASGRKFHDRLDEEFARHRKLEERGHPDDECHHRHVGVFMEMLYGGQPIKAAALYNRWAVFAGYGLVSVVAQEPLMVDIGNAVLQITGETFRVIKCR